MRRLIAFDCAGETLLGSLDEAPGTTGLLIVSGGNEIRAGAHRGMALLGQRLAAEAHVPVFRFDRRGVGDSTGCNRGFAHSRDDIAAALAAFHHAAPRVERFIGFGICDAATALALFHEQVGLDALVLANPWLCEETDDLPPAAAIRARYAARLKDPAEWLRLARGGVDLGKLAKGLAKAAQPAAPAEPAGRLASALDASPVPVTILLAEGDNTARAFAAAWRGPTFARVRTRATLAACPTASHSFAHAADKAWLFERLRGALR